MYTYNVVGEGRGEANILLPLTNLLHPFQVPTSSGKKLE
jgi:hypothetical protein